MQFTNTEVKRGAESLVTVGRPVPVKRLREAKLICSPGSGSEMANNETHGVIAAGYEAREG